MLINRIVILMLLRPLCVFLSILYATAALAQGTPQGLNALGSAGSLSTTDTMPVCQNSGGCGTSTPLKSATGSQISAFIASQGLTPAAGTCVIVAGWNVCAPSGTTTADADTAMLTTAFANAKAAPVWLSPGVYYTCGGSPGPASIVRGGTVAGPGGWIGVGAPGSSQINPWPYIASLAYCNNNSAPGPMFKVHDQTVMYGWGIQGTNALGSGSLTCVSAINTVSHYERDMQYIGCGISALGVGVSRTAAIDISSSSVSGDQGTLSQGFEFNHIGCFYSSPCIFGDNVNGGNGAADGKIHFIECEVNGLSCISIGVLGETQIDLVRAEDDGPAIELKNAQYVAISNVMCHSLSYGSCIQKDANNSGNDNIQISGLTMISFGGPAAVQVTEGTSSTEIIRLSNFFSPGSTFSAGLQYVHASGATSYIGADGSVTGFDAASKAILLVFGIPELEYNGAGYAWTLGAGPLQIPACASGTAGQMYIVSDSNTPTYGSNATGSGTTVTKVRCNGTNWVWN